MLSNSIIFSAAMVSLAFGQMEPTENYTHSATLRSGNIKLYWKFNETYITFEVIGQTTGWIGIGLSPNGAMTGAEMFVGWVKNGQVTITDRYGTANIFPPLDPQQDINILGGAESDGWTMLKFSRQLAACEADYDREITKSTQRLIYAYGDEDPTGDDITRMDKHEHANRGSESMYFLQSPNTPTDLPDDVEYETVDFLADNFEIPAVETYYNCKLFKLPELNSKHHIVKFEPVIEKGNELHVHHIVVFPCGNDLKNDSELGMDHECSSPNMGHRQTCITTVAAWAVGGSAVIYPFEAGYPIGETDDPKYFLLQMHYDNPEKKSGVTDNSGIRFTYTSTLRENDMGVVNVGVSPGRTDLLIPPHTQDFLSIAYCTSQCIKEKLTTGGVENITVFNVLLHSHLAGRKLKLRRIRNGIELPVVASDSSYDFNYQEYRFLDPYVILEKSDELQLECIYNTEDRNNITQGGGGTYDEMCQTFLSYYPKLDWGRCSSFVPTDTTYPYLGLEPSNVELIPGQDVRYFSSYNITAPPDVAGMTLYEYFNEYNWTTDGVKKFESFVNKAQHTQVCFSRFNPSSYEISPINITSPYVEPRKTCEVNSDTSSPSPDLSTTDNKVSPPLPDTTTSDGKMLGGSVTAMLITLIWSLTFTN